MSPPTNKSQALIIIYEDKLLLLKRKHPYGISDNLNLAFQRTYAEKEKRNIILYTCGKTNNFEDQFDFPKGRGDLFDDALKEVKEETGYIVKLDNVLKRFKNYARITYTGLDKKKYTIEIHVVVLNAMPPKTRRGEVHLFYPWWVNIDEACTYFDNDYDERLKSDKYSNILKNLKDDIER